MERSPLVEKTQLTEAVAAAVFGSNFETFAQDNPEAFRGRSVEIEEATGGHRRVFFTETAKSITAEHVVFYYGYSRITGALKLMKDLSPPRMWRPEGRDQYGAMLFALEQIPGNEATPEQLGDFTPIREALAYLEGNG